MKLESVLVVLCVATAGPVLADDAHHADSPKEPAAAATPAPQRSVDTDRRMRRMQDQMTAIAAANDPQERNRLMQEHMKAMHEAMSMSMPCMMRGEHGVGRSH